MKTINIQDLITESRIKEIMVAVFAKKTGIDKSKLEEYFDHIASRELDRIGKSIAEGHVNPATFSKLKDLSTSDFFKENDKIIKDK